MTPPENFLPLFRHTTSFGVVWCSSQCPSEDKILLVKSSLNKSVVTRNCRMAQPMYITSCTITQEVLGSVSRRGVVLFNRFDREMRPGCFMPKVERRAGGGVRGGCTGPAEETYM